ncbi:MAG: hypothetical protein [Circular genetic element sp.]|nr:MAG: hypothetical protein [Circular genetic element sp.]
MSINQIPINSYIKQVLHLVLDPETIVGNIRIEHKRQDEVTKLLKSLGGYLCVKEFTGCEHFHFAIEKPNVNRDTIAKKIRTAFPELKKQSIGGAKQYHVSHMKDDFQIYYLFKEWHIDTNPFTMTNFPLLTTQQDKYNNSNLHHYNPSDLKEAFAEYCINQYDEKKESFKKHTPGQFLEYLTKETNIITQKKNGVPDTDLDAGQHPDCIGVTHWSSDEFRRELVSVAIGYLKKIDIATCGPNKIWDLVNYAHLHIDQHEYTQHILYSSIR